MRPEPMFSPALVAKCASEFEILAVDRDYVLAACKHESSVPQYMEILKWLEPASDFPINYIVDPYFHQGSNLVASQADGVKIGFNFYTSAKKYRLSFGSTMFIKQEPDLSVGVDLVYQHPELGSLLPVDAGDSIAFHGLFSAHRCLGRAVLEVLSGGRETIDEFECLIEQGYQGGESPQDYQKVGGTFRIPEGAKYIKLKIEKYPGEKAGRDSYLFLTGLFLFRQRVGEGVLTRTPVTLGSGWLTRYVLLRASSSALPNEISKEIASAPKISVSVSPKREVVNAQFVTLEPKQCADLLPPIVGQSPRLRSYNRYALPRGKDRVAISKVLNHGATEGVEIRVAARATTSARISLIVRSGEINTALEGEHVIKSSWGEVCKKVESWPIDEVFIVVASTSSDGFLDIAYIVSLPESASSPWGLADFEEVYGGDNASVLALANRNYVKGISVVTPTGDRPLGFSLLLKWMERQTRKPDEWLIIDDGKSPLSEDMVAILPSYARVIRRARNANDYPHTLANQLLHALNYINYDKFIVMEDDDWYSSDYVSLMERELTGHDMVGLNKIHYYHFFSRQWKTGKPVANTSLAQTGFGVNAYDFLAKICESAIPGVRRNGLVDRFMWRSYPGSKRLVSEHTVVNVGLKGTPGRAGLAEGPRPTDANYQKDVEFTKLTEWLGNDVSMVVRTYGRLPKGVIYTAIAGGVDTLVDPEHVIDGVDYVCFADNLEITSRVWQIRPLAEIATDSVRVAKHPKVLPHKYFGEYEWSLWIDANLAIKGSLEGLLVEHLFEGSFFAFKHPERSCLYEEAQACIEKKKDSPTLIQGHVTRYKEEGFPDNFGMAECNVLLRRHREVAVIEAMELWWSEIERGSRRDQLSFSYVLWKTNLGFRFFFDGSHGLSKFPQLRKGAHLAPRGIKGSRIVYAAEVGAISSREYTKPSGPVHTVSQIVPVQFGKIFSVSVRIATYKGRASGPSSLNICGIRLSDGVRHEIPLGAGLVKDLESFDNRYAPVHFDEAVEVGEYSFIKLNFVSERNEKKRPISFWLMRGDPMAPSVQPLEVDGTLVGGMLCVAIQGL